MSKNAKRFHKEGFNEVAEKKHRERKEEKRREVRIKNKREDKSFWQWFCSLFASGD